MTWKFCVLVAAELMRTLGVKEKNKKSYLVGPVSHQISILSDCLFSEIKSPFAKILVCAPLCHTRVT